MIEIYPEELKEWFDTNKEFQLLDVREDFEREQLSIGGDFLPMSIVFDNVKKVKRDIPVVVMCSSGARSASVISLLEDFHGFDNLYNLEGGVVGYIHRIDPERNIY